MTENLKRLRLPQVVEKTGVKKTTIYSKIKNGKFPKPRKDGKISYWISAEIDNWIESQL